MTDVPNSPIVGQDGIPAEVGQLEYRRARASVEIVYRALPGEHVDIQALLYEACRLLGGEHSRDLGEVIAAVDLTEHVILNDTAPAAGGGAIIWRVVPGPVECMGGYRVDGAVRSNDPPVDTPPVPASLLLTEPGPRIRAIATILASPPHGHRALEAAVSLAHAVAADLDWQAVAAAWHAYCREFSRPALDDLARRLQDED